MSFLIVSGNLISALNKFAPVEKIIIKENCGSKLWWNHEVGEQIKKRDQLYHRAAITFTEEDWRNFKAHRNQVVTLIRQHEEN